MPLIILISIYESALCSYVRCGFGSCGYGRENVRIGHDVDDGTYPFPMQSLRENAPPGETPGSETKNDVALGCAANSTALVAMRGAFPSSSAPISHFRPVMNLRACMDTGITRIITRRRPEDVGTLAVPTFSPQLPPFWKPCFPSLLVFVVRDFCSSFPVTRTAALRGCLG